ncbi:MAG: hypothetical protein ACRDQA_09480 [Nocardioidaceae bacterium]
MVSPKIVSVPLVAALVAGAVCIFVAIGTDAARLPWIPLGIALVAAAGVGGIILTVIAGKRSEDKHSDRSSHRPRAAR